MSVVIPTLDPGDALESLANALDGQTVPAAEVIVMDSSSRTIAVPRATWRLVPVARGSFDHGATRNAGARLASGEVLVFASQDAVPARDDTIAQLIEPMTSRAASAAYARQVARSTASRREQFARRYNYPPEPQLRERGDVARLGVRALFFSNVLSACARSAFWRVGGFPEQVVMNEDMLFCARLLAAGHAVAYAAGSIVWHSHDHGPVQQFRRNYDIGAFFASTRSELGEGAGAGGEGRRFVQALFRDLVASSAWGELPAAAVDVAARASGYACGRRSDSTPAAVRRMLGANQAYWSRAR